MRWGGGEEGRRGRLEEGELRCAVPAPSSLAPHAAADFSRVVVLKAFPLDEVATVAGEATRQRLLRSLLLSRRVQHAGILRCEGAVHDRASNQFFAVSKYCAGGNLRQWVQKSPRSQRSKLEVLGEVARALGALHAAGVVHRDVKPENVLMDSPGDDARPLLTDFDTGKELHVLATARTAHAVGTLGFMPPESFAASGARADQKSDAFALGAAAVAVLVFDGDYAACPQRSAMHPDFAEGLRRSRTELVPKLVAMLTRSLAEDPAERPTVLELAHGFDLKPCFVCLGEEAVGLRCESGHFSCSRCVQGWVDALDESAAVENLRCFEPRCKAVPFPDVVVRANLDAGRCAKLQRARERFLVDATQRLERDDADKRVKRSEQLSVEELVVSRFRDKLQSEVVSQTCPNVQCGVAWERIDGCLAITCTACRTVFCGVCGKTGTSPAVHAHCNACPWMHGVQNALFANDVQVAAGRVAWRQAKVQERLDALGRIDARWRVMVERDAVVAEAMRGR